VLASLGERRLRRDGAQMWKPSRPLRDSASVGLATAPCIVVIALLQDIPVGEATATGATCGVIGFAGTGTFALLTRRDRPASVQPARADYELDSPD
jgi:hypothetical protein